MKGANDVTVGSINVTSLQSSMHAFDELKCDVIALQEIRASGVSLPGLQSAAAALGKSLILPYEGGARGVPGVALLSSRSAQAVQLPESLVDLGRQGRLMIARVAISKSEWMLVINFYGYVGARNDSTIAEVNEDCIAKEDF